MNGLNGLHYYNEGKLKESLEACHRLAEIDLYNSQGVYWQYFRIYLRNGEDLKAIEALQKLMPGNAMTIKEVYYKSGINGIFNYLIESEINKSTNYFRSLASLYAKLDKKEEELSWLEKAFKENLTNLPEINNNPDFDNVRSEPRYQAIIKKMSLSEYSKKE
jgi:tetratricopeptide (TPR) repeat protein